MSIQHLANHAQDRSLAALIERLNATATLYPSTNLQLVYEIAARHAARTTARTPAMLNLLELAEGGSLILHKTPDNTICSAPESCKS